MNEDPRPPRQREIPRYAPVVFDDTEDYADEPYDDLDEYGGEPPVREPPPPPPRPPRGGRGPGGGGGRGPGEYASDAGLLRVVALIAFLGFVILALVLPWSPIAVVGGDDGGGGDGDITTEVSGDLPNLPPGLVALSKMYEIEIPEGMQGPWTIEVRLDENTDDPRNLAYYSYDDGTWQRLVSVDLTGEGRVSGVLSEAPGSIAVLRRETTAANLGLLVEAGETPDPAAVNGATALAVRAGTVDEAGELTIDEDGASTARGGAGATPVYLGIGGVADAVLGAPAATTAHAEEIAAAVDAGQYAGAYLEYTSVPAASRDAFSTLVAELAVLLGEERGVIVGIPVEEGGGYDWAAILTAAEGIWLAPSADPTEYYAALEGVLREQFGAGVNLGQVWLVVDRRSTQLSDAGLTKITLEAALTPASAVDRGIEGGISTGDPVTLRAVNLETNPGGPALQWDPETRTVTYSYSTDDGEQTIWIENRFSIGFRLEVAQRYGLGGIVVDAAGTNPQLPAIWETVIAFIEEGEIVLEQPYGPYLVPCWEASAGEIEGASECWQSSEPAEAVVWRAPAQPGAYDIRLVVSDGTMFVAQELALNVATDAPDPAPTETEEPEESEPTEEPTEEPAEEPTEEPEEEPTEEPTEEPDPEATEELPPGPAGDDE